MLNPATMRGWLRLGSGLVLFTFVTMHLLSHVTLLISLDVATAALDVLMWVWWTRLGLVVLTLAALIHYLNALWSIYARRTLRLPSRDWWQIGLGICIPLLIMLHVSGSRVAAIVFDVEPSYSTVLLSHWVVSPWLAAVQIVAVVTVWTHGCIGMDTWLSTKAGYRAWRMRLGLVAVLLPTLALAGYITAGNQMRREVKYEPMLATRIQQQGRTSPEIVASVTRIAAAGIALHIALVLLPFGARAGRDWLFRRRKPPLLTHGNGRVMPIFAGASVLETLRDHGIPHAAACGGRARCTTCRVLVTAGLEHLPAPSPVEAKALARIDATLDVRLACQIRPVADLAIVPLLPPETKAADGSAHRSFEGRERPITVVFVDLRDSTRLGEVMLPYDVLFLLNQFFREMSRALVATNGHYSQFTGDGLMALYGLDEKDSAKGAQDAIRGAREMLRRLDLLNMQRRGQALPPLRIGIGIHFSEAIVGMMGPPQAQAVTAIGDTVNICARLESLTKVHGCPVIISRRAAETAALDIDGHELHSAPVKGRVGEVEFYAFQSLPEVSPAAAG